MNNSRQMSFILKRMFFLLLLVGTLNGFEGDFILLLNSEEIFDSYLNITDFEYNLDICDNYESEICAKDWLENFDRIKRRNNNRMINAKYEYSTNINKRTKELQRKFQYQYLEFNKRLRKIIQKFNWKKFQSSEIKRIFWILSSTIESKDELVSERLIEITDKITNIYNNGRPCFKYCLSKGENDIVSLFATERDYDKLVGFWSAWRNVTGRQIKDLFVERMELENKGAKENGYSDAASFKLIDDFEESNFKETITQLYAEILPLYKELHGYVRYCLSKFYLGKFEEKDPIPAHILGNVWAQNWNNIMPIIKKCRTEISNYDAQEEVNKTILLLTVAKMFHIAEEFFTSIGMYEMTSQFWRRSIVTKQPGKLMDCHGSAYDFHNGVDYRIRMCSRRNVNDFTTIHHEMGHIEYFMAYKELHVAFHGSSNPGFHEAVGDTIALSVKTQEHLLRIGLISKLSMIEDFDIDYLLVTALEKVAFLPFAFIVDSYIWSVYNGSVSYKELNKHWWDLRYRYQGIKPPTPRTENDFDPGAKYHIAIGISYIRYFTSFIYQFQFYEAMCKLSGYSGALHRCDFYHSVDAGKKLLQMLKKGKSQHWKDSLQILTGSRDIETKSLMKFFEPLLDWLKKTNRGLKIHIGW